MSEEGRHLVYLNDQQTYFTQISGKHRFSSLSIVPFILNNSRIHKINLIQDCDNSDSDVGIVREHVELSCILSTDLQKNSDGLWCPIEPFMRGIENCAPHCTLFILREKVAFQDFLRDNLFPLFSGSNELILEALDYLELLLMFENDWFWEQTKAEMKTILDRNRINYLGSFEKADFHLGITPQLGFYSWLLAKPHPELLKYGYHVLKDGNYGCDTESSQTVAYQSYRMKGWFI